MKTFLKLFFILALCVATTFALVACNGGNGNGAGSGGDSGGSQGGGSGNQGGSTGDGGNQGGGTPDSGNQGGSEGDEGGGEDDTTVTYTVTVTDENGNPIPLAWVQFCIGDICMMPIATGEDGKMTTTLDKGEWKFKVAFAPDGYEVSSD